MIKLVDLFSRHFSLYQFGGIERSLFEYLMLVVTRRTYYCCLSLDTMNKKTDWSIIAQCDYFAVKRFVQTAGREAMCTVVSMRETLFERKITRDVAWREAYEAVCQAYNQLKPNFAIR